MKLIVAEKPSVARDIARVLGVRGRGDGHVENDAYAITWCVGHLVELAEPAAYDGTWKAWRLDNLPMLPETFELVGAKHAIKQLRAVSKLLRDKRFDVVVNACDAGREGELIFRYVYQQARSRLPVQRLWISSMTDEAIRRGFASLQPGRAYDALGDAARSRSEADWLVGMNATRAVTVRGRDGGGTALYSIGRVQTPTLAMIVDRDREIAAFTPRPYWEVRGDFATNDGDAFTASWRAVGAPTGRAATSSNSGGADTSTGARSTSAGTSTGGSVGRLATAAMANAIVARDTPASAMVERVRSRTVREPPPLLFDLTSLQRTANKRFGFSASRTLEIAQALYERHKVLTYPRTDSRHLTADVARELRPVFVALTEVPPYAAFAERLVAEPPRPSRRVVDDSKVHDHHAIIPTGGHARLDRDEARVFDLVVRRFLGAFYPDAEFAVTEVWVTVAAESRSGPIDSAGRDDLPSPELEPPREGRGDGSIIILDALPPPPDRYLARGRVRVSAGWQEVAGMGAPGGREGGRGSRDDSDSVDRHVELPVLVEGQRLAGRYHAVAKQTTPPPHFTEATLLGGMETAGRSIDDEALRAAMKDCGLGTPATRASIIETLVKRGYIARDRQQLVATEVGVGLIRALRPSASLTRRDEGRASSGAASPADSMGAPSRVDPIGGTSRVDPAGAPSRADATSAPSIASLASAELTGSWEARLARIARGQESRASFMTDIRRFVTGIVDAIRGSPPPDAPPAAPIGRCPACGGGVVARVRNYACMACDFAMPNRVAARAIAPALAGVLLGRGRSQVLRGFRSKKGRTFSAALRLEPGGALAFDFGHGGPGSARANGSDDGGNGGAGGSNGRDDSANGAAGANARAGAANGRADFANDASNDRTNRHGGSRGRAVGRARRPRASRRSTNHTPTNHTTRTATTRAPAHDIDSLALSCPRCHEGKLIAGSRGWGCSRWRDGCRFVVWFVTAGKTLTTGQLRDLVTRGRTRKARFGDIDARLVLDVAADGGGARLEPVSA